MIKIYIIIICEIVIIYSATLLEECVLDYDKEYRIEIMDRFDAFVRFSEAQKTRPYSLVP